jgi:hypothetical protein
MNEKIPSDAVAAFLDHLARLLAREHIRRSANVTRRDGIPTPQPTSQAPASARRAASQAPTRGPIQDRSDRPRDAPPDVRP